MKNKKEFIGQNLVKITFMFLIFYVFILFLVTNNYFADNYSYEKPALVMGDDLSDSVRNYDNTLNNNNNIDLARVDEEEILHTKENGVQQPESKPTDKDTFFSVTLTKFPIFGLFISDNIAEFNINLEVIKLLLLVFSIVAIYAVLAYIKFLPNAFFRLIIAIILGILSSILITNDEILAFMESYRAMGIVGLLVVPIILLLIITFIVTIKFDTIGIVIQESLWALYAFYLFLKTGTLLLIKMAIWFPWIIEMEKMKKFFVFMLGKDYLNVIELNGSTMILIAMFLASILIWFIFVLGNRRLREWLISQKRDVETFADQDEAVRDKAAMKIRANSTRS